MKLKYPHLLLLFLVCSLTFPGCDQHIQKTTYSRTQAACAEPIGMIYTHHTLKFYETTVAYELKTPQTKQEYRRVYTFEKSGNFIVINKNNDDYFGDGLGKLKIVGDTLISQEGDKYSKSN